MAFTGPRFLMITGETPMIWWRKSVRWSAGDASNHQKTWSRSEEHTSELQSHVNLVCRLLLEKKKKKTTYSNTQNTTSTNCFYKLHIASVNPLARASVVVSVPA